MIVLLFLIAGELAILLIDYFQIKQFEEPVFACCQIIDENTRIYHGLGYSFVTHGNYDLDDENQGITHFQVRILGKNFRKGIRD